MLTEREEEIVKLLIKGYTNSEISEELSISNHTTKAHLSAIFAKLGVTNRVQAVVMYLGINTKVNI